MSRIWRWDEDARRADAARWVVRARSGDLTDAEAVAFDAWLDASPANGEAFDEALAVWREYDESARLVTARLVGRGDGRAAFDRRAALGLGIAAAAAVAIYAAPRLTPAPAATVYATATGERRTIALDDGSAIDLNSGARLTVRFTRDRRQVALERGQAIFDVAHDPRRPFVVAAGDRAIRVVGTRFDVRRLEGSVAVTVARGAVEVRPGEGAAGRAFRLRPGQRLEHREGSSDARIAAVDPAEVMSWRAGRLVFRDRPLGEVVADINQQFPAPIRLEDASLAAEPVSGVLVLDDRAAVVRRLTLLLPLRAVPSGAGVVLRRDPASDRK